MSDQQDLNAIFIGLMGIASVASLTLASKYFNAESLDQVVDPCLYQLHQQRLEKCEPALSAKKVERLYQLGITPEEVCSPQDTEKPNALLIYPLSDWNEAFYIQEQRKFVNNITTRYDSRVVIAEKYDEVNSTLSKAKDIDLLIISGHGSEAGIQLGAKEPSSSGFLLRDFQLNNWAMDDALKPDATIFLNSCSQGLYFKFFLPHHLERKRTVISSYRDFNISQVQVEEWYPLKLTILVDKKDVTKVGPLYSY